MQTALPHTTSTTPTVSALTRFIAAVGLVLFCLVRSAAFVHTHPHEAKQCEHTGSHTHDQETKHHSKNETEETCSLCDLITHSPLECPLILAFEASTLSFFAYTQLPTSTERISRTTRSLADRAPPTSPSLA